jgi:hypothetical protein
LLSSFVAKTDELCVSILDGRCCISPLIPDVRQQIIILGAVIIRQNIEKIGIECPALIGIGGIASRVVEVTNAAVAVYLVHVADQGGQQCRVRRGQVDANGPDHLQLPVGRSTPAIYSAYSEQLQISLLYLRRIERLRKYRLSLLPVGKFRVGNGRLVGIVVAGVGVESPLSDSVEVVLLLAGGVVLDEEGVGGVLDGVAGLKEERR